MSDKTPPVFDLVPAQSAPATVVVVQVATFSVDPVSAKAELRHAQRATAVLPGGQEQLAASLGAQLAERLLAPLSAPGMPLLEAAPAWVDDAPVIEASAPARVGLAGEVIEDASFELVEEAPAPEVHSAADPGLSRAVASAVAARRLHPRAAPGLFLDQYERLSISAWDGVALSLRPAVLRCVEGGPTSRDQGRDAARVVPGEAARQALLRALQAEQDAAANPLWRRVLGCGVGELSRAELGWLRRVFDGQGSPREWTDTLSLVDRYLGAPRGASPAAREEALLAYVEAQLGLAADGFARGYLRSLSGCVQGPIDARYPRADTDDLQVGDLMLWPDGRAAVVERVWNLLSRHTRVEVIEPRPGPLGDHGRATYRLQPGAGAGFFVLAETGEEVLLSAPL